jgi:outer membrane lipoprotein-sorting protein
MHGFSRTIITASILSSALLLIPLAAIAQGSKTSKKPVGAGWASQVKQADGSSSRTLTAEQMNSIAAVNSYFNQINYLKGLFSQTNPDGKVQRGKFYLMRPGRFRFDYNRPSRQIIVSDGKMLAIQDLDLNNEENYSLENTPFRILLRRNVDLLRDARIMAVEQSKQQIAVTITDKSPDSPGQITIYLTPEPASELAGWVTTDVQGGVTKVVVSNLDRPEKLNHKLFEPEKLFMKSIQ